MSAPKTKSAAQNGVDGARTPVSMVDLDMAAWNLVNCTGQGLCALTNRHGGNQQAIRG
ncbi:hypothetical protein ACP76Z_02585 [Vibrio cholerae]